MHNHKSKDEAKTKRGWEDIGLLQQLCGKALRHVGMLQGMLEPSCKSSRDGPRCHGSRAGSCSPPGSNNTAPQSPGTANGFQMGH